MSVFEAIVLGIVQGLTEFLPISSSAHLILVPWLFDWDEPGLAFDAALHLGTLGAVFAYFWRDLWGMLLAVPDAVRRPAALFRDAPGGADGRQLSARLAWLLVIGSVPGGIVGLLAQDTIDDFFHNDEHEARTAVLIAIVLIAFALLLWAADRYAVRRRRFPDVGIADAVAVGIAQALALFPGVSRSGVTLTAGLWRGLERADAARFSFLLGAPLVTVAGLKGLTDLVRDSGGIGAWPIVAGLVTSTVSGFAAIWLLLRLLQTSPPVVFVVYRILAGIAVLIIVGTGVR